MFIGIAAGLAVVVAAVLVVVVFVSGGGGCGGDDAVRLNFVSSPEKLGIVKRAAKDYSGREVDGKCVEVSVQNKSSGEAMAALARGWNAQFDGPQPDVWSPASSGWVSLLRHRLGGAGDTTLVPERTPGIAAAPLVIAMPRRMAQALGWPNRPLGWDDILRLSRDPRGWGRYGHPEWGPFKLGKTNPNFSTSGLNATVGAYFAATQRSADLTAADLGKAGVQSYVRGVESSIVHYGDTTLTFLEGLRRADAAGQGLSYVSAVAVEEMSVWYYNQGNPTGNPALAGKNPRPKTQLVAIYPKEGTLISDHPHVTLGNIPAGKRAAAADFLRYLRGSRVQQAFAKDAFRSHDNRPAAATTQANGLLPNQPQKTIAPPAPDVLDRVLQSWELLRKRANVLLVVDVSGSMNEQVKGTGKSRMALAKESLGKAVDTFVGVDRVGLWEFSSNLRGRIDHRPVVPLAVIGEAGRKQALKSRIAGLKTRGDTGLYDTTLAAYQHVQANRRPGAINSVVVLTDGKNDDPSGGISLNALLARLKATSTVKVFTVAYGTGADAGALKKISEATDAASYNSSDAATLDKVLTNVTSNF